MGDFLVSDGVGREERGTKERKVFLGKTLKGNSTLIPDMLHVR